jgi:hypothetical protein
LTDFIGSAIAVSSADLLANIFDAKLVRKAVGVGAAYRLTKFGVTLKKRDKEMLQCCYAVVSLK